MQQQDAAVPALRQDLQLFEGPTTNKGEPCWLIYDPVRHRYFRLTQSVFEVLGIWNGTTVGEVRSAAENSLNRHLSDQEIAEITKFLFANNLTDEPASGDAVDYADQLRAATKSFWSHVVHGYLFFRIPLLHPHRFLSATMPAVEFLYSPIVRWVIGLLSLVGLYLASRQWEAFSAAFFDFLTLEGAFSYALGLVFIKTLHELGHAYTATRYGVRVHTMGIAFMVMMPVLFTDVTDSWRLKSRAKKLAIDGAGIGVELAVAGLATLLWVFLPDGHLRSVAFVLASTSWIMSLAINLNPFMRFDGYYLLADAWGIPNLQSRSFAIAKWWLREKLFALGHPPPEPFAPKTRRALVAYAIGTWIYRLTLFIGIALIVYHLFFKVLGIVLFAVEIIWFIALPVWREFKEWWNMRQGLLASKRSLITAVLVASLALVALVPWSGTVTFQAVLAAKRETQIFAPRPAYIQQILFNDGTYVDAGDKIVQLTSPKLDFDRTQTERQIALLESRLLRIAGDPEDRLYRGVIASELKAKRQKLDGLKQEQDLLTVRAPFSGIVKDVNSDIAARQWIDHKTPIARIIALGSMEAKGYVSENDVWRLQLKQDAFFVPEDPVMSHQRLQLLEISKAGVEQLDILYLSTIYGGDVSSDRNGAGDIIPRSGHYLVRLAHTDAPWNRTVRGTVHISGKPESFAAAAWRRVLQVLVRESGV